jgi:hypothetical protein
MREEGLFDSKGRFVGYSDDALAAMPPAARAAYDNVKLAADEAVAAEIEVADATKAVKEAMAALRVAEQNAPKGPTHLELVRAMIASG